MRRRSSVQRSALDGNTMTGRKIPHVSGMASALLLSRRRTERSILWNLEIFKTVLIQESSKSGFECADTQARRARPARSLSRTNENPRAHAKTAATASLLKIAGADAAVMMTEGIAPEPGLVAFARAGIQRAAALPRVAECQVGSSSEKQRSASEASM